MGGAGLALPFDAVHTAKLNPAKLAFGRKTLTLSMPTVSIGTRNIKLSEVRDYLKDSDNGTDGGSLTDLAKEFGDQNFDLGAWAEWGLTTSMWQLRGHGSVSAKVRPNSVLRDEVRNGNQVFSAGAQADGYAVGQTSVEIATARPVGSGAAIGIRVKSVRAYYSHFIADADDLNDVTDPEPAPELNGRDSVSRSGLAFDLGYLTPIGKDNRTYFGAVVNNVVQPSTSFDFQSPDNGDAPARTRTVNTFRRSLDIGIGHLGASHTMAALDVADVSNANRTREFRLGFEKGLGRFAVRAGYGSRRGLTFGVGFLGINLSTTSRGGASFATQFKI